MYNISDKASFEHTRNYIMKVKENTPENFIKVLVGNNYDQSDRAVTEEEGKKLADEFGIPFLEASPTTNQTIDEVFSYLVSEILKSEEQKKNGGIKIKPENKDQSKRKKECAK